MSGLSLTARRLLVDHGGPRPALAAIDLHIAAGEQLALIGPSGAGKTTALSALGAALEPDSGTVLIDGVDPWTLDSRALRLLRGRLFIAPQAPPLPPRQRVVTAVLAGRLPQWSLWRALRSLWHPLDVEAAFDALERFSIGDKLWRHVDELSGGERQRVALARALVSNAELLLLDEPLSALDPTLGAQIMNVLVDAARERGATLVCNLHHVEIAMQCFRRVVGLRDGAIVFDRAATDISPQEIDALYAQADPGRAQHTEPVQELRMPGSARCI